MEKSAIKNMHGSTTLIFSQKLEKKKLWRFQIFEYCTFFWMFKQDHYAFALFQKKIRHLASIDSVIRFLSVQISTNANHYQVRHKLYNFFFCKCVLTIN